MLYINWNPDPVIFNIGGFSFRWYSLFWVVAIAMGAFVVHRVFERKNLSEDNYNKLFVYSFLGIFIVSSDIIIFSFSYSFVFFSK